MLTRPLPTASRAAPAPQVDVGLSTDAQGQLDLLLGVLQRDFRLSPEEIAAKLISGAFDGAAVYQGHLSGVGVLLEVR